MAGRHGFCRLWRVGSHLWEHRCLGKRIISGGSSPSCVRRSKQAHGPGCLQMPRSRSKDRHECLEAQEQVWDMHMLTQAYHLHGYMYTCPHRLNILTATHHISTEHAQVQIHRHTPTGPLMHTGAQIFTHRHIFTTLVHTHTANT